MLSSISALLFPRNCVGCGEALHGLAKRNEWEYLCHFCAADVRAVGDEACERCGVPVYGVTIGRRICSVCKEHPPVWGRAKSLVRYIGPARGWIRNYKYHDARWVEREWFKLLKAPQFAWVGEYIKDCLLIPVPLHPIRRFMRGFNQSEELAKLLKMTFMLDKCQLSVDILHRIKWTRQQARLPREKRLKNVKNAFAIAKTKSPDEITARRVVLIDDLLTTGSTLTACVQVLKKAGFKDVDILTLARG